MMIIVENSCSSFKCWILDLYYFKVCVGVGVSVFGYLHTSVGALGGQRCQILQEPEIQL